MRNKQELREKLLTLRKELEEAVNSGDVVLARNYYIQFKAVYYEAYGFDFEPIVPQDSLRILKNFLELDD